MLAGQLRGLGGRKLGAFGRWLHLGRLAANLNGGQGPNASTDGSEPLREGGPGGLFTPTAATSRRMKARTIDFQEVSPAKRASDAHPLTLPLGEVSTIQTSLMDGEDMAGPPPLL